MGIFEIISAIILIVACVFIVIVVLMKDTKTQMSQTISGSSTDSFYQKNAGRTKEAMLNKATIAAAIVFFVLAILVNVINVYFGGSDSGTSSTYDYDAIADTTVVTDEADIAEAVGEDTAAADAEAESEIEGADAGVATSDTVLITTDAQAAEDAE